MLYLYTNKVLLRNSSNSPPKFPFKFFFFPLFLKPSNLIGKNFAPLVILIGLGISTPKIYNFINKNPDGLWT